MISILLSTVEEARPLQISIAVKSLLKQEFDDFELLISDDGSSEETAKYLETLPSQDSRVQVFREEAPVYSSPICFARSFERADPNRPFLMLLHADCMLLPEALKLLTDRLRFDSTLHFTFGSLLTYLADDSYGRTRREGNLEKGLHQSRMSGVLVRKEILGHVGWFDAGVVFREAADSDYFSRLMESMKGASIHRDSAQFFPPYSTAGGFVEAADRLRLLEKYRTLRNEQRWPLTREAAILHPQDKIPVGDWSREELTQLFSTVIEYYLSVGDLEKASEWSRRLETKIDNFPPTLIDSPLFRNGLVLGLAKGRAAERETAKVAIDYLAAKKALSDERIKGMELTERLRHIESRYSAAVSSVEKKSAEAELLAQQLRAHQIELAALRHRFVDNINSLLKRPPFLHRVLKNFARAIGRIRKPVRLPPASKAREA